MECPRWWATLYIFIYFLLPDVNILCQNVPTEIVSPRSIQMKDRDIDRLNLPPTASSSKAQFINTLLNIASNGALPDRAGPIMQPQLTEKLLETPALDDRPKTINIIPLQPQTPYYPREPIASQQPSNNQLVVKSTSLTTPYTAQPQQLTKIESTQYNGYPRTTLAMPVENYANYQSPPSYNPQQFNDAYSYRVVNPITSPPMNLQISPPSSIITEINNDSEAMEILSGPNPATYIQESKIIGSDDDGLPLNLQINLPSQNVPAPRITVVSAVPPATTASTEKEFNSFSPFGFLPPPVMMRRSKSSWKNLLPIILIALFNDQGGCCCNCNCDSSDPIPIPYPIPIPVNNPIINNRRSYSSHKKDEDIEDDRKRK